MPTKLRKFVAGEQIFGAVAWFLFVYPQVVEPSQPPGKAFIVAFFGVLNLAAFFAGLLLWRGAKHGLALSLPTQALQVPIVQFSRFSYTYFSGVSLIAALAAASRGAHLGFRLHFGAASELIVGGLLRNGFAIGVDISALVTLTILLRALRSQRIGDAMPSQNIFPS